ncbi:MAG: M15 family metallopeptidase [Aliarcobacter sp.]|nr:M15 family metallopeptidase [Aliarcobacter sp.]
MLKKFITSILLIVNYQNIELFASNEDEQNLLKLAKAYPTFIKEISNNKLIFMDNHQMNYDDYIENKTYEEMLKNPSLKNQMSMKYIKIDENLNYIPIKNEDAGRIRYEPFFKKMYGSNPEEIKKNLTKIIWLPKSSNKTLLVTTINDVHKKLQAISDELDLLSDELKSFVDNPAGVTNYRKISNTNRLSSHSFGIAIDINVKNSDYWQWHKENKKLEYKNKIPLQIVKIFEKHGFIWGGRWYHYDTMHFEYRPELLN